MNTEPVSRVEAIRLVLVALLGALPLFTPVSFTEAQTAALLGVYAAISIVLASFTRESVVPVPVVNEIARRRSLPGGSIRATVRPGEYRQAHQAVKNAA